VPAKPLYAFFAVPHQGDTAALRDAVNIAAAQAGLTLMRADQIFAPSRSVEEEIQTGLTRAAIVIGEVTDANPNVMWELGYARARGIPVVLLTQDPGRIPFDLRSARAVTYQPTAPLESLVARLADALVGVLRGPEDSIQTSDSIARNHVFFSYSHADALYLDRMLVHLRPIERTGAINLWSDTKIKPGARWREEIREAIDAARIAVLLVSADFLASEFIVTNELPPLLAAAESQGALVVPVILKPSRFLRDESLSRFQALNDPRNPVIRMAEADREDLYARLAELIETELRT
jgi:nucleoside 2-deoxyribosyltransferase